MDSNEVTIVVTSKDDSGAGFASATARTKAYQALVDQTTRKEIAAHGAVRQAESAHERATRLLADAEKVLSVNTDSTSSSQGRLSRVLGSLGGMFSSLGTSMEGAVSNLPFVGSGLGAIVPAGSAALPVLAAIAAAFTAVLLALGPLVAGLGLITVGIAAFAAAAIPSITAVITARQKLTAAEKAYDNATTKAQRVAALKAEKMATEGLTGAQKQLLHPMDQIAGQFHKLQKAVEPQVIRAFGSALDIIRKVMPALTPLAIAAGEALDHFLGNIDHWLSSASGKKFVHWMETEGPKAIATFGRYLTGLIHVVGEVMYWWDRLGNDVIKAGKRIITTGEQISRQLSGSFSSVEKGAANVAKSVNQLHIPFAAIARLIGSAFVLAAEAMIRAIGANIRAIGAFLQATGNVIHAIANIVHAIGNVIHAFDAMASAAENAFSSAMHAVNSIPVAGPIAKYLGFEHGGIVGAAQGGGPKGGWTMVGERGRELVRLPTGSSVYSAPDTQRMLGAGGGPALVLNFSRSQRGLDLLFQQWLIDFIQHTTRVNGGGDVQVAFGHSY